MQIVYTDPGILQRHLDKSFAENTPHDYGDNMPIIEALSNASAALANVMVERNLNGRGNWLAEATDGKSSSMAVGLGPDGGRATVDQQNLDALTKSFEANPNTVVQGAGFLTIAGRKCMWHKLSVPAPGGAAAASAAARTSAVIYFAPLGDGRALKVRVVSREDRQAAAQ